MLPPFLEALDERVLVCDGAMGTMLYAQGVFINRSFDSLNLSDPERVLEDVREGYVSIEQAREQYGVAIDATTWTVLTDETTKLRAARLGG